MGFSRSLFPIAGLITRMNETLFVRRADELNQKSSSGYIVFITQLSSRLILCAKLTIAPASNDRKDKGLVMRIVDRWQAFRGWISFHSLLHGLGGRNSYQVIGAWPDEVFGCTQNDQTQGSL
jgi:hypothetical protein